MGVVNNAILLTKVEVFAAHCLILNCSIFHGHGDETSPLVPLSGEPMPERIYSNVATNS